MPVIDVLLRISVLVMEYLLLQHSCLKIAFFRRPSGRSKLAPELKGAAASTAWSLGG